jgi:predicted AlkP superfamily phosphohydrolase/phosphomutase
MKSKEFIVIVIIGLIAGLALAWGGLNMRSSSPPEVARRNTEAPAGESPDEGFVDPRWGSLNPTAYDQVQYIDEETFHFEGETGFRPRLAVPPGKVLEPDIPVRFDLLSSPGQLGLIIEARAALADSEIARFQSELHEGVWLNEEIPLENAPRLVVQVEGEAPHTLALTSKAWKPYYVPLSGDGRRKEITLEIQGRAGRTAAVKKAALFSQDAGEGKKGFTRIHPLEGSLRAEALGRKVVLLGLDGIAWEIVNPMIQQGKLPNLEKLIQRGVSADLIDEPPLDSTKIWTTIATGRNPRRSADDPEGHGITNRVYKSSVGDDLIPVNRTMRGKKALWNMLSDMGRTVGVLGWFCTWPAEVVNGFMVTDRARLDVSHTVYPEILGKQRARYLAGEEDLAKDVSPYAENLKKLRRLSRQPDQVVKNHLEREELKMLVNRAEEVYFSDSFYLNFGLDLFKQYMPDFYSLYFHGTDAVSHAFYKFRFPGELEYDFSPELAQAVNDPIEAIYRFHDRTLGRLVEEAGPETIFIVMSDHGFQAQPLDLEKIFIYDLDSFFEQLGLLTYWKGQEIDWSETVCYTSRQLEWNPVAFVRLNVEGREGQGIITPDRLESKRQEIMEQLRQIRFEKSGRPVFTVQLDSDKEAKGLLDFKVRPAIEPEDFNDRVVVGNQKIPTSEIFSVVPISGTHKIEGVYIMAGPGVKENFRLDEPVKTIDVTPTILALTGLPVGEDLHGRVRTEAMTEEFLKQVPIRSIPSYELFGLPSGNQKEKSRDNYSYNPQIDAVVHQDFQALGYVN